MIIFLLKNIVNPFINSHKFDMIANDCENVFKKKL